MKELSQIESNCQKLINLVKQNNFYLTIAYWTGKRGYGDVIYTNHSKDFIFSNIDAWFNEILSDHITQLSECQNEKNDEYYYKLACIDNEKKALFEKWSDEFDYLLNEYLSTPINSKIEMLQDEINLTYDNRRKSQLEDKYDDYTTRNIDTQFYSLFHEYLQHVEPMVDNWYNDIITFFVKIDYIESETYLKLEKNEIV